MIFTNKKPLWTILLLLIVYSSLISLTPRAANDFPYISQILPAGWQWPSTWSTRGDVLGNYGAATLWSWPMNVIYGSAVWIGLPFFLVERLVGILPVLLIGWWSIRRLLTKLQIDSWGKEVATFIFLANSYLLLLIDGGQLSIALTYAWIPVVINCFEQSFAGSWKQLWLTVLSILVLSFLDIRFLLIAALIIGVLLSYYLYFASWIQRRKALLNCILIALVSLPFLIGLHAYWILPAVLAKAPFLPISYTQSSQVSFLSFATILHSLLLQQPHWPANVFGRVAVADWRFVIYPLLAFLPLMVRRSRAVVAWSAIALLGIFLSKGSNPPFPTIYQWLFTTIPGFSVFRDPSKFFFLTALAYSVLSGLAIKSWNRQVVLTGVTLTYLLFVVQAVYLGQSTGLFSTHPQLSEYQQLNQLIADDRQTGRVLWVPSRPALAALTPNHPGIETLQLTTKRPFSMGIKGAYDLKNFLREASYSGQLLDILGVHHLVFPPLDARRDDMHPENVAYHQLFTEQIADQPWIKGYLANSAIPVLETRSWQPDISLASAGWWIIGADDLYLQATQSARLNLKQNALIFSDQYPGLANQLATTDLPVVLHNKTETDLQASFIPKEQLIFPADQLADHPDSQNWWRRQSSDLINFRDFLQTKYQLTNWDFDLNGGWAVNENQGQLVVSLPEIKEPSILLARVLESSRSGQLQFAVNDRQVNTVQTKQPQINLRWQQIASLPPLVGNQLTIQAQGDISLLNALAVVPESQWQQYQQMVADLKKQGRVRSSLPNSTASSSATIQWQKVSPTEYKLSVQGLSKPAILIFNQNFNQLWTLNKQPAVPVFSMINGFPIQSDGDYRLTFAAQPYLNQGLIISGLTLLAVTLITLLGIIVL